jgi:uncharacterized membrane protein
MTPSVFFISLTILFIVLLIRKKIADFLNETLPFPFEIKTEWIVYLLLFLLSILLILGMIMGVSDNPFGKVTVGGGIETMGESPDRKPHRYFDINFDIFNF